MMISFSIENVVLLYYSDILECIIIGPIQGLLELLVDVYFLSIFLEAGVAEKHSQVALFSHGGYYLVGNALGEAGHKVRQPLL